MSAMSSRGRRVRRRPFALGLLLAGILIAGSPWRGLPRLAAAPAAEPGPARQKGRFIGEAPIFGGRYESIEGAPELRSTGVLFNIGLAPVTLKYAYYDSRGTVFSEFVPSAPLAAGETATATISRADQGLGNFGLVVTADGPVASVTYSASDLGTVNASDAYLSPIGLGFGLAAQPRLAAWAQTLVPRIYKRFQNLTSVIGIGDRVGSSSSFALTYYTPAGAPVVSRTVQLPSEGSALVDLSREAALPDGFVGSAVLVPQTVPGQRAEAVAAVRTILSGEGLVIASDAYSVAPRAARVLLAPALFRGHRSQSATLTSELCVQSGEARPQTVTARYGDGIVRSTSLAPFASHCFSQAQEPHAAGWSGGAVVEGAGALGGVVFVTGDARKATEPDPAAVDRWSYTLLAPAELTRHALVPVKQDDAGFDSLIYAFNPHAVPVDLLARFAGGVERSVAVPARGQAVLATAVAPFGLSTVRLFAERPLALAVSNAVDIGARESSLYQIDGFEAPYSLPEYAPAPALPLTLLPGEPGDPSYGDQGLLDALGAATMWRRGVTGVPKGGAVTVAVIDTGVVLAHPDLAGSLNLALDYDFVFNDGSAEDLDGHGTEVAGLIAARRNNGLGVAGVAGGDAKAGVAPVQILPLRVAVSVDEAVSCQRVARAVRYAIGKAQVINMSLTAAPCGELYQALVDAYSAGMVVVAGAGNDGSAEFAYPAAYGEDGAGPPNARLVVAVCGLASGDLKHPDSSYGPWVDLCAPYGPGLSTSLAADRSTPAYRSIAGTSASTALVSGLVAALMANEGLGRDQAIARLLERARDVSDANPDYAGMLGAGALDAARATWERDPAVRRMWLPTVSR